MMVVVVMMMVLSMTSREREGDCVEVVVVVGERPRLARMNNVVTTGQWPFPATHTQCGTGCRGYLPCAGVHAVIRR